MNSRHSWGVGALERQRGLGGIHAERPALPARILPTVLVVGRIFKANAAPVGSPWMWTLAFRHHEDRTPTHGYAATREDGQ
jgi:hypothetical protein